MSNIDGNHCKLVMLYVNCQTLEVTLKNVKEDCESR